MGGMILARIYEVKSGHLTEKYNGLELYDTNNSELVTTIYPPIPEYGMEDGYMDRIQQILDAAQKTPYQIINDSQGLGCAEPNLFYWKDQTCNYIDDIIYFWEKWIEERKRIYEAELIVSFNPTRFKRNMENSHQAYSHSVIYEKTGDKYIYWHQTTAEYPYNPYNGLFETHDSNEAESLIRNRKLTFEQLCERLWRERRMEYEIRIN